MLAAGHVLNVQSGLSNSPEALNLLVNAMSAFSIVNFFPPDVLLHWVDELQKMYHITKNMYHITK